MSNNILNSLRKRLTFDFMLDFTVELTPKRSHCSRFSRILIIQVSEQGWAGRKRLSLSGWCFSWFMEQWIEDKQQFGLRRFSSFGKARVFSEWLVCCMATNTAQLAARIEQGKVGTPFWYRIKACPAEETAWLHFNSQTFTGTSLSSCLFTSSKQK